MSTRNVLVVINSEPVAVCAGQTGADLAQSAHTFTNVVDCALAIPLAPGRRRVGSLEGGNTVSCQSPQDQDRGAAICYVAELPGANTQKHARDPVADSLELPFSDRLPSLSPRQQVRSIDQLNDVHRLLDRA